MGMNLQGKIKHLFNKLNEVMKQATRTQKQPELMTINDRTNSAHGKIYFYDQWPDKKKLNKIYKDRLRHPFHLADAFVQRDLQ